MMRLRLLIVPLMLTPALARAEAGPAGQSVATSGGPLPCQCRALGQMWEVGSEVCLDLGRGRLAYVCGMDQNVTSWKQTERRCPES